MEEKNENRVWLGKDGIVRMKVGQVINEEVVYELVEKLKQVLETMSGKKLILVDVSSTNPVPEAPFRKRVVKIIKDFFMGSEYKKMAIFGRKSVIQKVIAVFIIRATKLKNIEYFTSEEEALKWLKEP